MFVRRDSLGSFVPMSQSMAASSSFGDAALRAEQDRLRALRKNKLFRRIEADIKERDRKRVPGRPEQYVDRDRIIAVTLGETDIRETMMKQRMFLTKSTSGSPSGIGFEESQGFKVLVQQAEYELHRAEFERALAYLNKAIRMIPEDCECLMLRGACLVGVQRYRAALRDADSVLERQPCSRAYLVKGDALYHLGRFEHALVQYSRALATTATAREEEAVRFAVGRATKAIDNALGARAATHFIAAAGIIARISPKIFDMSWNELRHVSSGDVLSDVDSGHGSREGESLRAKKYHRQLLGKLSQDLDYLELLSETVGANSRTGRGQSKVLAIPANAVPTTTAATATTNSSVSSSVCDLGAKRLKEEALDAVSFLKARQEFWIQFKPMYTQRKQHTKI